MSWLEKNYFERLGFSRKHINFLLRASAPFAIGLDRACHAHDGAHSPAVVERGATPTTPRPAFS